MEETAGQFDIKRGPGGLVDTEFLVQTLQLKHGRDDPSVRAPNTLDALAALHRAGYLPEADFEALTNNYRWLRTLESRLRLMNPNARDQLPTDPAECDKLAAVLGFSGGEALRQRFEDVVRQTRNIFDQQLEAAR